MPDNTIVTMDDLTDFTTGLKNVLDTSYSGGGTTPEALETLKTEILEGVEEIVHPKHHVNPDKGLFPNFITLYGYFYNVSFSNENTFTQDFIENIENLDLSKVQSVYHAIIPFLGIPSSEYSQFRRDFNGFNDFSQWDQKFGGHVIPSYNLSKFDLRNIINITLDPTNSQVGGFFYNYQYGNIIENLDISNWKLPKLTSLSCIFHGTSTKYKVLIKNLKMENWEIPNVTSISGMFYNIYTPTVDLSTWDLSYVIDLANAFYGANIERLLWGGSLSGNLDVSSLFKVSNVVSLENIEDFIDSLSEKTVDSTVTITIPSVDISGTDILSKATAKGYTLTGYSAA